MRADGTGRVSGKRTWPSFRSLAGSAAADRGYIAGIPQTGAPSGKFIGLANGTHPALIAWPESPAPFVESDPTLPGIR